MQLIIPLPVHQIFLKFINKKYEIYLVGGSVRDLLLGRIIDDWDFTTNATPKEILKIIEGGLYNNKFGTVFSPNPDNPQRPYEITTYRKEEVYKDARHPESLSWGDSLQEDLKRREATISAMAIKLISTIKVEKAKKQAVCEVEIIDLYKGQEDLNKKLFRAIGNPSERFNEDALRMMRAVRISTQLGFKIENNTFEAIKQNAPLINKISKERIKEELFKILLSPNPSLGISLLKDSGLLSQIIPELEKSFGVEQKSPSRHHIYDVGNHLLMSLKNCKSADPVVRFATLIHDIGKPQTYKKLKNGIITFYNHEMVSTKIAENIADRLRFSNKEKDKLITLVRFHQFTVDERQTDSAIRRFIRNVGIENISDMLDLRTADRLGGGASETSWRLEEFKKRLIEVQKQPFSVRDLKINGRDVMNTLNIKPGPKVGEILNNLFKLVEEKKLENKKSVLLSEIEKLS